MSKNKLSESPNPSSRRWKVRQLDRQEAIVRIGQYCDGVGGEQQFVTDPKTLDACIRNFQILGDAAKQVPGVIQKEFPEVPWSKIKGMRNIVVHEYFGVSPKIIWRTIAKDLPSLLTTLRNLNARLAQPIRPWRICAPGETYVRSAVVHGHEREGSPVREHLRRDHCRELESSGRDVLSRSEVEDIAAIFF